jgi:anti-sigma factor RsiW
MPHIDEEALERYVLNQSPEPELEAVEEHLLICEECRAALNRAEIEISSIREALRRQEAEPDAETADFNMPDLRRREVS